MGPGKGGEPKGKLADDIKSTFGSFDQFQGENLLPRGAGRFGSGWAWLIKNKRRQTRSDFDGQPGFAVNGRQTRRSWASTFGSMPTT